MRYLLLVFLLVTSTSTKSEPPAVDSASSGAATAPDEMADDEFARLTMDELIALLPPAGKELRRGRTMGEIGFHPASEEMQRRLAAGAELTDEQWVSALLSTGAIRFRPKWPKDQEYVLSLTVPRWLGLVQIRLLPRTEALQATSVGRLLAGFSGTGAAIDARDARLGRRLGKLPPETTEIIFDVEIERGRNFLSLKNEGDQEPPGILWEGSIRIPVEIVDDLPQIADPVNEERIAEAVRDAIGAGFRPWGSAVNVPFVLIDPDITRFPFLKDIGLSIRVEVLRGEQVVAESRLIASDFDTLALFSSICSDSERYYGSANLVIPEDEIEEWTLRLTGTDDHLLILWHARRYWSGTITIPWNAAVEHEMQRTADRPRGPEMGTPYWK